jgi:hypothetical protein
MKPVVSQASGGQTVDRRFRDIRTVPTELGKSEVVEQDYHDVGAAFGGRGGWLNYASHSIPSKV